MLIDRDDISNDLSRVFQLGNWRWNSNSRDVVASSSSFSCPAARASRRVCSQAIFPSELRAVVKLCPVQRFTCHQEAEIGQNSAVKLEGGLALLASRQQGESSKRSEDRRGQQPLNHKRPQDIR